MGAVDDPVEAGTAAAAINTVQLICGAFGAGLAGVVVNMTEGGDAAAARWLFTVFAVLAAAGFAASYRATPRALVSDLMDAFSAGQLSRSLDRLHSTIYFVPEAGEMFGKLGLEPRMQYFASRSAPMGAVTAKVVAATFYNFNPELIAQAIPAAWDVASPEAVTRVRYEIVDAALPRSWGRSGSPRRSSRTPPRLCVGPPRRSRMPTGGRCMPDTRNWIGPMRRTPSCGTRSPCCASTAVTAISPRWSRTGSAASRH